MPASSITSFFNTEKQNKILDRDYRDQKINLKKEEELKKGLIRDQGESSLTLFPTVWKYILKEVISKGKTKH